MTTNPFRPEAVVSLAGKSYTVALTVEALAIMATPDLAERAKGQGFRVDARGPAEFGSFLKAEVERWGRIITAAKIQPD